MADFCNQCKAELLLTFDGEEDPPDYPDYGPLGEGMGWPVICEGCGFTTIDRYGNCSGNHSIKGVKHIAPPTFPRTGTKTTP
jgi:hypothetical protein